MMFDNSESMTHEAHQYTSSKSVRASYGTDLRRARTSRTPYVHIKGDGKALE